MLSGALFALLTPLRAAGFQPIDLKPYYNFALTNALIGKGPLHGPNHLGALPSGQSDFSGVPFDVNGIAQLASKQSVLAGKKFADKIDGIKIGGKASIVHVLHGAGWDDEENVPISKMLIHYADGAVAEAKIIYGKHVVDWWDNNPETAPKDPATVIGWHGQNRVSKMFGTEIRLYRTPFRNPRPEAEIAQISFVSENRNAATFILGVTLQGF